MIEFRGSSGTSDEARLVYEKGFIEYEDLQEVQGDECLTDRMCQIWIKKNCLGSFLLKDD